jgi:hypothetical protein
LFDDLILNIRVSDKEPEDGRNKEALENDFGLDFVHIKGIAEIQVSINYAVPGETSQYTAYSLHGNVKSKWSQRMYELCQKWQVQTASESQMMN